MSLTGRLRIFATTLREQWQEPDGAAWCEEAVAEIERLQAIVDQVPKLGDGVVALPKMVIYEPMAGKEIRSLRIGNSWEKQDTWSRPISVHAREIDCFSTLEAAKAAGGE